MTHIELYYQDNMYFKNNPYATAPLLYCTHN